MIREFTKINIKQIPTDIWKSRTREIPLDFCHDYKISLGWETKTDKASIGFPKNIQLILKNDGEDFLFKEKGTYDVLLGGSTDEKLSLTEIQIAPLIMKGDIVSIDNGYLFKNENGENLKVSSDSGGGNRFKGYVSRVHAKVPIKIELEDNFYLMKQTPANKTLWVGNLVDLCKYLINQTNSKFHNTNGSYPELTFYENTDKLTANFSLGHLIIGEDKTCAQVLQHIEDRYKIQSFFKGDVLHFGFPIYTEDDADSNSFFEFGNNIKDNHSLEYSNKDDVQLSAIVKSQSIKDSGKVTLDGNSGTKKETTSVLIYWDVVSRSFKYEEKKRGESFKENKAGERHEFIYSVDLSKPKPSIKDLVDYGILHLEKYFYTGFRGSFTTIGYPFVDWNDNVNIVDPILKDRNGQYKVKKVEIRGGDNGIEQEIFLDFKQQTQVPTSTEQLWMI